MQRDCTSRERNRTLFSKQGLLLLLITIVLIVITGCTSYPPDVYLRQTPSVTVAPPRHLITHSTLPLHEAWRRDVRKTSENGSFIVRSANIFLAQPDTVYVVAYHPTAGDPIRPLQIIALNAQTGQQRWTTEQTGQIHSFTVGATILVVASADGIAAYNIANGKKEWISNQPPPDHEGYTASFVDSRLYLIIDRGGRYIYGQLDPNSGIVGDMQESDKVLTKIDSKYRYTWTLGDTLWLEDVDTGQSEQIISLPHGASPLREDNTLVIPYRGQGPTVWHSVIVEDLSTKQKLWECSECFASDVAIDAGKLYAIQRDGTLAVYDLITGSLAGTVEFQKGSEIDPYRKLYGVTASNGYVFLYFGDTQELIALGPDN